MSAILRWFHDGDVRYRAYFRASESAPTGRELIVASVEGQAADVVDRDRRLEDFSTAELIAYARRLRAGLTHESTMRVAESAGAAAD